jgi:hypothetical protein
MRCHNLAAAALSLVFSFGQTPAAAFQTSPAESQVKATFLYNFAQFIEWPSQAFTDRNTPFTMCLTGDSLGGMLEKTVEGETLSGRRITVRRLNPSDSLRACHLVYVGKLEARRSMEVIAAADGMPLLTVGDAEDFINLGGMIRFTEVGNRVRFEINPDPAERVALRVSSRLLKLADIARPRQGPAKP